MEAWSLCRLEAGDCESILSLGASTARTVLERILEDSFGTSDPDLFEIAQELMQRISMRVRIVRNRAGLPQMS